LLLWIVFLCLTSLIILFPATLKYEYSDFPAPFLYIFHNFNLFAVMYYLWLLLLMVLLFTRGNERTVEWEKAALVAMFALVFAGYSTFMTRGLVGDAFTPAGDIKNLLQQGHFSTPLALKYNGFPGFSLLGTGVSLVTGLSTVNYMMIFTFFQILFFAIMLFLLFNRLTKNPYFAAWGAVITIQVDVSIATQLPQFHAGAFTPFCLVVTLLWLLLVARSGKKGRWFGLEPNDFLIIGVFIAIGISHLVTSVTVFLIILGIYTFQKIGKKKIISDRLAFILLLVPAVWNLALNFSMVKYFANMVYHAIPDIFSGRIFREWLLPMQTTSYVGSRAPLWTAFPLYLGPLLIVIVGGILWLVGLFRLKRADQDRYFIFGGLAGIVVLALILLFLGSLQESYGRTMVYIAFFTVPIILWWLISLNTLRKYVFSILAILVFVISLPAFLLDSKSIAGSTYYPREQASGEFLESVYSNGSGLYLYGMEGSVYYLTYYLPSAHLEHAYPPDFRSTSTAAMWQSVFDYVSASETALADVKGATLIMMFSPKWDVPFRNYAGVDVIGSPEWEQLESRLSVNNVIYSNGFVRIYQRRF
jgi:hypothetical protein